MAQTGLDPIERLPSTPPSRRLARNVRPGPETPYESSEPEDLENIASAYGRLRLRTFIALRWLAIAGQLAAICLVHFGLGFDLPLAWCLGIIALAMWFNIFIMLAAPAQRLARQWEAACQLAFDIAQLSVLVGLTGGLLNPFVLMVIAPVTVAAATLKLRYAMSLGLLACAFALGLNYFSMPLPWYPDELLALPVLYRLGLACALIVGILFSIFYAWRVSREEAELIDALAAAQGVLERERRLFALGGLAAAAAHELGTPLATIHIAAKEILADLPAQSPLGDDIRLIVSQSERCRAILRQLSRRGEAGDLVHEQLSLAQAMEEAAHPFQGLGPRILVRMAPANADLTPNALPDAKKPALMLKRRPEIQHGLGSIIENACSFASEEIVIEGRFDDQIVEILVRDDGPGFPDEILTKLGQPFVTSRNAQQDQGGGMGLGFFIAKTLLERTGASLQFANAAAPRTGAIVRVAWPRERVELQNG